MSKGKFSNPRPYREEEREIEKSFRQLTGQEKPPKPEDPIFFQASVPDLDAADPEAAARLHPNDRKRIVRALEVFQQTGKTISQHNRETRALSPRYDALTLSLAFLRREDMWARIDRRVDEMMAAGLAEEVRALLDSGVPVRCTAMQAIGYKEMAAALRGGGGDQAPLPAVRQAPAHLVPPYRRGQMALLGTGT